MGNFNWTNRPTQIRKWEKDVDYVMFIDENGMSDITHILKKIMKGKEILEEEKFFTVTGVIFTKPSYRIAKDEINALKNKYWKNGYFEYKDKLQKVCFHSREIRRGSGPFNYTLIDYEGWGNGGVGKLIVKNSPIGCMGAGDKGYFFTGSNYVGAGAETGANNIICSGTYSSFSEGSVEFHNCVYGLTRNALIERIKKCFNMKYGIDRAYGYEFVGMTLIENGIAFAKHPIRKFKCPLRNANTKNSDGTVARYDYTSTTAEGRVVDGITFNNNPILDNLQYLLLWK